MLEIRSHVQGSLLAIKSIRFESGYDIISHPELLNAPHDDEEGDTYGYGSDAEEKEGAEDAAVDELSVPLSVSVTRDGHGRKKGHLVSEEDFLFECETMYQYLDSICGSKNESVT